MKNRTGKSKDPQTLTIRGEMPRIPAGTGSHMKRRTRIVWSTQDKSPPNAAHTDSGLSLG